MWRPLLALALLLLYGVVPATAGPGAEPRYWCRLIIDAETGKILSQEGKGFDERFSPCSTFKVPLALIGYESGILKDLEEPAWDYRPEYNAAREEERQRTVPIGWMHSSVVWYSRRLTQEVGEAAFQRYIGSFDYGNDDLSGDPGKQNGLTQSWLGSSLKISPREQTAFLRRMLRGELPVSNDVVEMTKATLPRFDIDGGWTVVGKTGSGLQKKADGTSERRMHYGWFVGWAEKPTGKGTVIFAEFLMDASPHDQYAGPRCRESLLKALPEKLQNLP